MGLSFLLSVLRSSDSSAGGKLCQHYGALLAHDACWMALALKMNQEYNGHQIIIERPDGQRLTALAYANPMHDEAGTLLGAVNVLVDITERKQAEEQLQASLHEKEVLLSIPIARGR